MGLLSGIRKNFKSISRYNQILRVLIKYGFEDLVNYLDERKQFAFFQKLLPNSFKQHALQYSKWAKMRLVCEELGPTFVKFGQILSNRPDLIPLELTLELEKLQDNVPPMSQKEAINVIEIELKDKVENLFAWMDPYPFASASMAQVHKATLHSGKRIALKIQRSGISDVITEDIKVMYRIADVLERRVPSVKNFDPIGIVKNFESSILQELDFINESINVDRFYNNLKKDDAIDQYALAPKVYHEFTTSKVLALEFISGIKIDKISELKEKGFDTKVIARRMAISYYKQIFEYGFFHADPHPGNLLVLPNGHIGYLDFGMMGSMLPRDIAIFGNLFIAISEKNIKGIIKVIQKLSNGFIVPNMRDLEYDINEFVEKYYVRDVHKNEMSIILLELKDIIIKNELKVPSYFFLFARSLVTLDGVIEKLDHDLDQFEIVRPYLRKSVTRKYNPFTIGKKVVNSTLEMIDYMEDFPADIRNAIRKINSGHIKADLTHKGIDPIRISMRQMTRQLTTTFIMVSLIISAALFIVNRIYPLWKNISIIGIFSFILAVILGIHMVVSIRKEDYGK